MAFGMADGKMQLFPLKKGLSPFRHPDGGQFPAGFLPEKPGQQPPSGLVAAFSLQFQSADQGFFHGQPSFLHFLLLYPALATVSIKGIPAQRSLLFGEIVNFL
jgi:hypothetical protein